MISGHVSVRRRAVRKENKCLWGHQLPLFSRGRFGSRGYPEDSGESSPPLVVASLHSKTGMSRAIRSESLLMFPSTTTENFRSWDKFLDVYYEPIRIALGLIPFVGEERADDLAQSFFLKLYERDFLIKRPAIVGRFRNWLYVAARRHALDELRKIRRRPEHADSFEAQEPADPHAPRLGRCDLRF